MFISQNLANMSPKVEKKHRLYSGHPCAKPKIWAPTIVKEGEDRYQGTAVNSATRVFDINGPSGFLKKNLHLFYGANKKCQFVLEEEKKSLGLEK